MYAFGSVLAFGAIHRAGGEGRGKGRTGSHLRDGSLAAQVAPRAPRLHYPTVIFTLYRDHGVRAPVQTDTRALVCAEYANLRTAQ